MDKQIVTYNIKEPDQLRSTNLGEVDWEKIAKGLWGILDDISTSYDHYKPSIYNTHSTHKCLRYISTKAENRHRYMSSPDGYELVPKGVNELPKIDDADAMTRWFREAWVIEKDSYQ
jgi:hypothetical protein